MVGRQNWLTITACAQFVIGRSILNAKFLKCVEMSCRKRNAYCGGIRKTATLLTKQIFHLTQLTGHSGHVVIKRRSLERLALHHENVVCAILKEFWHIISSPSAGLMNSPNRNCPKYRRVQLVFCESGEHPKTKLSLDNALVVCNISL